MQYSVDWLSAIMGAFIVLCDTSIHVYFSFLSELLSYPVTSAKTYTQRYSVDVVCKIQFL